MEMNSSDQIAIALKKGLEEARLNSGLSSVQPLEEQLYFKHYYNPDNITQGSQGSFAQVNLKVLNLHDKKLRVSYINPLIAPNEKHLEELITKLEHRDIITMIKSDKSPLLESLGFEAVVEQQICNIPASSLPEFTVRGIVLDPPAVDLKIAFDSYSNYFTGYFERNISYFEDMKRDSIFLKGKIVGLSKDDKLVGYVRCVSHASYVEVLECCYDTSGTLLRLLSFVSKGFSRVIYKTNASEKIHKLLPHIKVTNDVVMMARVNDKKLFEQLFHIKIISSYSAFNAFSKPVLNTDLF